MAADEEDDREPACDITGLCEPFPEDEADNFASCMHCGGWRQKDYPRPGNWGVPD